MTTNGFNPMDDHAAIVASEGHHALAEQKNRQNLQRLLAGRASVYNPDGEPGEPLRQFAELLVIATERGLTVVAFIYPFHAEFLQSIAVTGRSEAYNQWKHALAELFSAHAPKQSGHAWMLWDFGVYAEPTVEPVPARRDNAARMRWWWEPGHYKAAFGDRMLRQMLGRTTDFGVVLTAETARPHLARQAILAQQFRANHPQLISNLRRLCPRDSCTLPSPQTQAYRL